MRSWRLCASSLNGRASGVAALALALFWGASATADGLPTAEIERSVAELDANQFGTRQAAAERLAEMGQGAFPALQKAAHSDSREVSARSIEILKQHLEGGDNPTKAAAKEALETIAQSGEGAIARRASEALLPPAPLRIAMPVPVPMQRIAAAQIQIRLNQRNIRGGNVRRISTRIANGVREVNAEENGRKTKIVESQANGIEIEVTETKNGKETTQKYQARDVADLKTKHPDAHKIYEQYGGRGVIPIQVARPAIPNRPRPPGAVPNFAPIPPAPPQPNPVDDQLKRLDESIKSMDDAIERFRGLKPAGDASSQRESSRRMIETLEKNRQRLQEMRTRAAARN
jgi:hypothetical protein